jgi:hypothetical protein
VKVIGLAYLLGFFIVSTLMQTKDKTLKRHAIGPIGSTLVPLLAIATSRYLMQATAIRGTTLFVLASAVLSMLFGFVAVSARSKIVRR